MKKVITSILVAAGAFALVFPSLTACTTAADSTKSATDSTVTKGAIVYFDMDRVLQEYDMANDLTAVINTKAQSIEQEINRRGSKLEKDQKAFEDKVNKGLLTQSTAEIQYRKLQEDQQAFQAYANQKQQEIAEEATTTQNQILDAISTFVKDYNADKGYAMILTTQGMLLSAPVVTADESLDITEDLLAGLNAAYVEQKGKTE